MSGTAAQEERLKWAANARADDMLEHVQKAIRIIELADNRAMAADGPVSHVRDEMSDKEWRDLYLALLAARAAYSSEAPKER